MSRPEEKDFVGTTFDDRFLVKRRLGGGGFGTVYLAEQKIFGINLRPVAIKLFRSDKVTRENASEILNDAIVLMQLQQDQDHLKVAHNLVTVYDAGFFRDLPGQAYMSMEYVEGYSIQGGGAISTLSGLMRRFRPVAIHLSLRWILQILEPLAWMHNRRWPVLHCDLKPENILVSSKDDLKIADFGLSQLAIGLIGMGDAGGTLPYMAPELLLGLHPTPAADVYSLGVIFYEMLAGENPLCHISSDNASGDDRYAHIKARKEGLPSLYEYDHPELKHYPLFMDIIERCLSFDALDRYVNADHLLKDIRRFIDKERITPGPPKGIDPPKDVPKEAYILEEARSFIRKGMIKEAISRCETAKRLYPRSAKPYRCMAEICMSKKDWQKALKVCSKGLEIDPDEPELFHAMADAYDMGKMPPVAIQMRKKAIALERKM